MRTGLLQRAAGRGLLWMLGRRADGRHARAWPRVPEDAYTVVRRDGLDPVAALIVVLFIAYAGWEIAVSTSNILSDRVVIAQDDLRAVVLSVPGILGCHQIRTRGSADYVFLDLHVWMRADMPLAEAHAKSHVVKDLLMQRYPQIADAVIHIEPPPLRGGGMQNAK